jgi:hypothetical protein
MSLNLSDSYGINRTPNGVEQSCRGEIELIYKDINGQEIARHRENNIIKIFAKEILSHRLIPANVWDPDTSSYVTHSIDVDDYAPRYLVFGASFDSNGNPLNTTDTRYYTLDSITGGYIPKTLGVGADYDGGLINAIPISEPYRPLKRVERIFYESSYQPAGTPLLQDDVRAINNVVVFETIMRKDEYNGFGLTDSDYFTITEVALVGAPELTTDLTSCECDPRDLFLTSDTTTAMLATANSGATITLDAGVDATFLKEGDQIKIVEPSSTAVADAILDQINPYYLITSKAVSGRDVTLDRVPKDSTGVALSGNIGVYRDTFRIYSHRILKSPAKKSDAVELTIRWRIIFN